jgi:putative transport protein
VVALTGIALAFGLSKLFGFDFGIGAGLLAGALTSTPTLVGAQDAIASGLAMLPDGLDARQAGRNLSVGYAITYLFGTAGLIALVRYAPVLLKIDLPAEARTLARERGLVEPHAAHGAPDLPVIRAYRVTDERAVGKTLCELQRTSGRQFCPLRIRRGPELLEPHPDLELQDGDIAASIISLNELRALQKFVGEEVLDRELLDFEIASREIVVTRPEAFARPLIELDLPLQHGCFPIGVIRASVRVPLHDSLKLARGDRLLVTGEKQRLEGLAQRLGYIEAEVEETDLLTLALGIVGGLVLGTLLVKLGDLSIGLGSAGGLLLMGILIGFLRSLHPTFGGVPPAARFILMQLGLMLFMANVGLRAGADIVSALVSVGPMLVLSGVVVTLGPLVVAYAVGRYAFAMNPALLLGSITGAMTSTPALSVVNEAAQSPLPALGYAGTYTFANVFLTFAGTLMVTL